MILTFVHSKGGVGKSAIAVHLAVGLHDLGHRVKLIDADDENMTSSLWVPAAEPNIDVVRALSTDQIEDAVRNTEQYDFVIVDAPGGMAKRTNQENRLLLFYSDFVLIPVPPRFSDIEPLPIVERVISEAEEARGVPLQVRILANLIDNRTNASKEVIAAVQSVTGLPVLKATIPVCEYFNKAHTNGTVITRMKIKHAAVDALNRLLAELMSDMVASLNKQLPQPPTAGRSSASRPTEESVDDRKQVNV